METTGIIIVAVTFTVLVCALLFVGNQYYQWRKIARRQQEFINTPNVHVPDKEQEYKDTFEARLNALDEERRQIHTAVEEVFDLLCDKAGDDVALQQCRNVLLKALQISTYGRG